VAPKNPLSRLVGTAVHTAKDPVGTAGKVVGQAKETVSWVVTLAEQLTRSAVDVLERATGRGPDRTAGVSTPLRPVPDVNEAGRPVDVPEPTEPAGPVEPSEPAEAAATKSAAKKAPATKASAKRATAKKAPAKKAPGKKATAKKAPAKKAPAKKASGRQAPATPNDVAKTVEAAVAEDPSKTAATPAPTGAGDKLPVSKSKDKPSGTGRTSTRSASTAAGDTKPAAPEEGGSAG